MTRLLTRCLFFSLTLLGYGCAADYKALQSTGIDQACIDRLRPRGIASSWYDASIDVVGRHISGLLLVKNMNDTTSRVVFTNEAGVKFLDFEIFSNGAYKVHHVIRQLNRKAVIGLLQKDFALMLGVPFNATPWKAWATDTAIFYGVPQKKEICYFITGKECASLQRIESGSKRKRKVTLMLYGDVQKPDSIHLQHHTFAMQIKLTKIARD
jgi:hypothetical protein